MIQCATELFGIELINQSAFTELLVRLACNMISTILIIRYIYYPIAKSKEYFFSFLLTSTIVFLLCFLLGNVKLQIGFALGLFAIFGIIRYRTTTMPIKEMTYLFLVIGLCVINALANKKVSYAELALTNIVIIGITYIGERFWLHNHESHKVIHFENLELLKPEKRDELLVDLKARTGLTITHLEIGDIDFLRDSAKIRIWFIDDHYYNFHRDDSI
jgi:hypothetical protein